MANINYIKTCEACGAEFHSQRVDARYCSRRCYMRTRTMSKTRQQPGQPQEYRERNVQNGDIWYTMMTGSKVELDNSNMQQFAAMKWQQERNDFNVTLDAKNREIEELKAKLARYEKAIREFEDENGELETENERLERKVEELQEELRNSQSVGNIAKTLGGLAMQAFANSPHGGKLMGIVEKVMELQGVEDESGLVEPTPEEKPNIDDVQGLVEPIKKESKDEQK